MAAAGRFKFLVLVAIVASCAMQHAFAAPSAVENRNTAVVAVPPELQIIGETAVKMVQVFGEFVQNVTQIVLEPVAKGSWRFMMCGYMKAHAVLTNCGIDDISLHLTVDQLKEYRIFAKTVERLRQRLDTMERVEEVIDSTCDQSLDLENFSHNLRQYSDSHALLGAMVKDFSAKLDQRLKQHPELRKAYVQVRESIAKEYENVDLKPINFFQYQMELGGFSTQIRFKIMISLMNKQFLLTAYRRAFTAEKYFILARSTLELAKKSNNVGKVQQIYDESLAEAAPAVHSDYFNSVWDMQEALFSKLKEKFENSPALNHELRIIEKNFADKHDWDRKSIWDINVMPWW